MTFVERYKTEQDWYNRVLIMEIYHLTAKKSHPNWTLFQTAEVFEVSVGLVSENLRIAKASHTFPKILNIKTREAALEMVKFLYSGGDIK